jgi:hypothetical protein
MPETQGGWGVENRGADARASGCFGIHARVGENLRHCIHCRREARRDVFDEGIVS